MHKHTLRPRAGFTLIELLTVIAIIGILAAILFPAIGAAKKAAYKANDLANLKSIGQAALVYASDNSDRLPDPQRISNPIKGGTKYKQWFALLAKGGNLSDPTILVSKLDALYPPDLPTAILKPDDPTKTVMDDNFANTQFVPSYEVVGGIKASDPSTTPIAFTRGLQTTGKWDTNSGTYGADGGGLIVYVGGNVSQYKSIGSPSLLIQTTGNTTLNILQAIPYVATGNQRVYGPSGANGGTTVGSSDGTKSIAPGSASGTTD